MKFLVLIFALLFSNSALAASSITFTITVTGNPDVIRTYALSDSDAALLIPAYQQGANIMVNGTATRAQVLRYMIQTFVDLMTQTVTSYQTQNQINTLPPIIPIKPQ